jgi:hypothetical protein
MGDTSVLLGGHDLHHPTQDTKQKDVKALELTRAIQKLKLPDLVVERLEVSISYFGTP